MKRKIATIGMSVGLFESFRGAFAQEDISVIGFAGINEAKAIMVQEIITLIVLHVPDWPMYHIQGVIRSIRQLYQVPVLVITPILEYAPLIEDGADFCVSPELPLSTILAAAMSLIRRQTRFRECKIDAPECAVVTRGELVIDPTFHRVTLSDEVIHLQSREFRLLLYFARNPGVLVTPKTIYEIVWEKEHEFNRNVAPVISELRRKLGDTRANPTYIETVHGFGYRFLPQK